MREMLLGVAVVCVVAGLVIGRHSERVRRNYKDYGTAKTAVTKYRQTVMGTIWSSAAKILAWGAVVAFAIFLFMNLPPSRP